MTSHMMVIGDDVITYSIIRTRRRSVEIRVNKDSSVTVRAPSRMPFSQISEMVRKKAKWIEKHRILFMDSDPSTPRKYVSGEYHEYLGGRYELIVSEGGTNSLVLDGGRILLTAKDASPEYVKAIIYSWYRTRAREIFEEILKRRFAEMGDRLGGEMPALKIRIMKRRWGTCQPMKRSVTLNLELMRADPDLIEYVVLHELCHLKFRNHDKRFYGMLFAYCGDWKAKKTRLNRMMLC